MGRLNRLELENFKSYSGKQIVGPFDNFTCIIGPNGSGKSNMMDAISFVLGVQSKHLRSSHLKELIFRKDADSAPARKAIVKLFYEVSSNEVEIDGNIKPDGSEVEFSRSISSTGVSSYRLDNKDVSYELYESVLLQIGVLVKARNFLVFQGDIESVASKSPSELTKLFEQICGSEPLSLEYETLKKKKEEAEENTIFSMQKKKMFLTQCKEIKGQKEEAEFFLEKKEEISLLKTESVLWNIWRIKSDMEDHQNFVITHKSELDVVKSHELEIENEMQESKKELAKLSKLLSNAEKENNNKNKLLDDVTPKLMETKAKLKSLHKRIQEITRSETNVKKDLKEQSDSIRDLRQDIDKLTAESVELKRKIDNPTESGKGVKIDGAKMKEYSRLRGEVSAQTMQEHAEQMVLEPDLAGKKQQLQRLDSQIKNLSDDIKTGEESVVSNESRVELLKSGMMASTKEKDQLAIRREQAVEEMKQSTDRVRDMTNEIETINENLRDAGDDRRRGKHEERITEAIDTMQRIYKGVHGKLADLCKPIQKKYSHAVTVSAGKHMDAIVVDSRTTAADCIRYLKDQRIGTCMFLPLDYIVVPQLSDRLRSFGNKYKLCIDLIECDNVFKPAVQYAVGSTLVCETLEEAQDLCFNRQERVKVVTLKGNVINKSGAMTGGSTASIRESGPDRWEEKEIEKLRKKKSSLEESIMKINNEMPTRQTLVDIDTNIRSLQNKFQYAEADLKVSEEKLKNLKQQQVLKKGELKKLTKESESLQTDISKIEKRKLELQQFVREVENDIFAKFSSDVGVQNIREYEENSLKKHQEMLLRYSVVSKQSASLIAQLEYIEKRDFDNILKRLQLQLSDTQKEIKKLEDEETEYLSIEEGLRSVIKVNNSKLKELKDKRNDIMNSIKVNQNRKSEIMSDKDSIAKKFANEEILIEKNRAQLHEILQKALVDEISLPVVDASDGGGVNEGGSALSENNSNNELIWTGSQLSSSKKSKLSQSSKQKHNIESEDSSGTNSKETSTTRFSQSENPVVMRDSKKMAQVDISSMRKYKNMTKAMVVEKEMELSTKIADLSLELEAIQPNMHASERYDGVVDKLHECSDELENTKEMAKDIATRFEEVKKQRQQLFQDCYKRISEALGVIYKDLTRSSKHPLGGNAYLTLDNQDEPYLGGIRFTAMPPMKRFRDMDQLSGGEKTMAALALLFSIHSYRQAPFFVLDEVDAALDNVNVKKICNYIKQRSMDFQCVVISLKEMFFEHADCLVGICKDVQSLSSKILTLDLGQYNTPTQQLVEDSKEEEEELSPVAGKSEEPEDGDEEDPEEEEEDLGRGRGRGKRKMPTTKTSKTTTTVMKIVSNKQKLKQRQKIYEETIAEGDESENSS